MRRLFRTFVDGGGQEAINPANLPGLMWYLNSTQKVWADAAGTVPATGLVQRWDDLGPNGYNVSQALAGSRPSLALAATPAGHQAVRFGPSPANNQLARVPGGSVTIPPGNAAGYTCYMWFNADTVDHVGKPGNIVLDITNASGFRFDNQFAGADVTALEYAPGSFGLTVPRTGWDMWTFVCNPPRVRHRRHSDIPQRGAGGAVPQRLWIGGGHGLEHAASGRVLCQWQPG